MRLGVLDARLGNRRVAVGRKWRALARSYYVGELLDPDRRGRGCIRHASKFKPPEACPQCQSLVWDYEVWPATLFSKGASWVCLGCGFELWETVDDAGKREHGERWATCQCCGRVLESGEAAISGYGALCASGQCHCRDRAWLRDQKRIKRL